MKKKWLNPEYHEPEESCADIGKPRRKPPALLLYILALIIGSALAGEIARII